MRDERLPQVDIFLLAYVVGMLVGHIPFLASGFEWLLLVAKFVLSVPLYLVVFAIYATNVHRLHRRPVFWSVVAFLFALLLLAAVSAAWFWGADYLAGAIAVPVVVFFPALAISCLCFILLIRRRFPKVG